MSESSLGTDYKESRTSNHSAYYCHEELRLFSSVNNTKPCSVECDVAFYHSKIPNDSAFSYIRGEMHKFLKSFTMMLLQCIKTIDLHVLLQLRGANKQTHSSPLKCMHT